MSSDAKLSATPVDFDPFAGEQILFTAPSTEPQKEIWASVQMGDDANRSFNESVSLRFTGPLDIEALHRAFVQLVERHDALRTVFGADGMTLCVTAAPRAIAMPLTDLSALDETSRSARLAAMLSDAVEKPFNLERGPLFETDIFKLGEREYHLIFTAHHIICDGWSFGVLLPELGELYSAQKRGSAPSLPPAYPFSAYARDQATYLKSKEHAAAAAFWDGRFAVAAPPLDLPTDKPRPAYRTFVSLREDLTLDANLVAGLKRAGAKAGCSFFVMALAAFEAFLFRITDQEDLVVGIPAAGQSVAGHERLVGHCVNLLPLRARIAPEVSFTDLLRSLKTVVLDAFENQQYTYGSLVKRLALPRDPSRIPLVSVLFNIDQGLDTDRIKFEGLAVQFRSNPRHFENFELFVNALETGGALILECQYNTALFSPDTIRRRLEEFKSLLEGVAADPAAPIAKLPLLTSEERRLLAQWNGSPVPAVDSACLHQLFEAQVRRTPTADAVLFGKEKISYDVLNRRANAVAHRLQELGVAPETLVGICMERSIEMVAAMLGILKAGGAYVPLDPKYPKERVAFMVEDSRVSVIVTEERFAAQLPVQSAKLLCLDAPENAAASGSQDDLVAPVKPTNLAYVIYTSGSTGKPKGVAIEHRCPVALARWARTVFSDTELSGVLASTSICFDLSVFELFVTFASGGTVILAENVLALPTLPERDKVVLVNSVPSAVSELLSAHDLPPSVATVNLAGEPLTAALVNKLYAFATVKHVYDLYGPSEDTTYSTFALRIANGPQTIGRPLPGTTAHILDGRMQQVPIGVPGELWLGGAKLARGYLNRPELTAERFVRDPFGAGRLYKTGDRARYFPDGTIEFLGRQDFQVKVRGFRIELGEIESTLLGYPPIRHAAVAVVEVKPGDARLVAFLVVKEGASFDAAACRDHVRRTLPDYMVPQHFVALDALPLTATQKIDRKKLPSLFALEESRADHYAAPATMTQQTLSAIWREVLGFSKIGIHDNFFDIGGHSLLVTKVISRIRRDLGIELAMRHLFEMPTIHLLSTHIDAVLRVRSGASVMASDKAEHEEIEL